jgi:hypothetical protein
MVVLELVGAFYSQSTFSDHSKTHSMTKAVAIVALVLLAAAIGARAETRM